MRLNRFKMQINLNEGCKLFILSDKGIQEIEPEKVGVTFKDKIPTYFLKNGKGNEIIVQALNKKFASKKLLEILIKKRNQNG
jgi:hypothetical protein